MLKPALLNKSPDRMFESLYQRHVKDVYRYSLAMLDRQVDAEDATQTTFMNAYRALERGERPRDAAKWLRAIALNVCREHYRRAGRRPAEVSLDEDPGDLVQDPPTPEIGDVIRGLSCLPFNQRTALVMREFEGRSLSEIATALDVSASSVETLLFRARRALREQLEGTLTCSEAEYAISRQLDGALPRDQRGQLRAHLRACAECASLARRLRAQRTAIRSLGAVIPIPVSLKFFKLTGSDAAPAPVATVAGAGSSAGASVLAALTGSALTKVAAATVAGVGALGLGYATLHKHATPRHVRAAVARTGTVAAPQRLVLAAEEHRKLASEVVRRGADVQPPAVRRETASSHRRSAAARSGAHVHAASRRSGHEKHLVNAGVAATPGAGHRHAVHARGRATERTNRKATRILPAKPQPHRDRPHSAPSRPIRAGGSADKTRSH